MQRTPTKSRSYEILGGQWTTTPSHRATSLPTDFHMHGKLPGYGTSRKGWQGQEVSSPVAPELVPGRVGQNGTQFRSTCSKQGCFQLPLSRLDRARTPTRQGRHLHPLAEGLRHCALEPPSRLDPCPSGGAEVPSEPAAALLQLRVVGKPGAQALKAAAFLAASALPGLGQLEPPWMTICTCPYSSESPWLPDCPHLPGSRRGPNRSGERTRVTPSLERPWGRPTPHPEAPSLALFPPHHPSTPDVPVSLMWLITSPT